jgi:XTP/dITP diphosphohydrolase
VTPNRARYVLATANRDKAAEIETILSECLGDTIEIVARPAFVAEVEEDRDTLLENARLKAGALIKATGLAAIADDTGLEVDALGGAPGVYSARFAGIGSTYEDNVEKLLAVLGNRKDRAASFRSIALVVFPNGDECYAEGIVMGTIALAPHGSAGFGYDPVFVPNGGNGRSFAEMSAQEKHRYSHRGLAFRSLAELLKSRRDAGISSGGM